MKNTEIITSHNVVIQYDLAPPLIRTLATVIDLLIVGFGTWIFAAIMIWVGYESFGREMSFGEAYIIVIILSIVLTLVALTKKLKGLLIATIVAFCGFQLAFVFLKFSGNNAFRTGLGIETEELIGYIVVIPVVCFYNLFCELNFKGQSLGKIAMKIRVVKTDGQTPTLSDYFLRWALRPVDIAFSFGAIGFMFAYSTEKGQRLGDIVANTCVISLSPQYDYSVRDILKIKNSSNHEISFPTATRLTDEDVIIIKQSIDRVTKYPNESNKQIVLDLAHNVIHKLGVSEEVPKKLRFLKTVLQDYVVLTR